MKVKVCTKFFVTMLFIIVILLGGTTSSFANNEYSVSMALTSNSNNIKEGEVITINVNLTNINAGDGIDVLTAKLNYDTNIFEILSSSDFSSNTNWNISFAPSTNMLTAIKNTKVTKGENVFCIRLKVKSNINTNSTNVSLQNIIASGGAITFGGTGDINVNNISINLKKVEDQNKYNSTTKNSVTMKMDSNSSLEEGKIVTIKVDLTNINAGNGIDVLSAKLNYDTNVFEILSSSDFSSNTNWNISFASSTNMLTAIKNTKVTKGENVFCIRLKVKSNINANSTNVSLQNIVASGGAITFGGTGDINVNNIYVTLNKVIGETNKSNNSSVNKDLGILKNNDYIDDINIDSDNDTDIYEENVDIIDENNQLNENNNTNILKENKIVAQKINTNSLDTNINDKTINVERAIIGSSSSISFISICFYLFRKLKFGI